MSDKFIKSLFAVVKHAKEVKMLCRGKTNYILLEISVQLL